MNSITAWVRRVCSFALVPALSTLVTILIIPEVTRQFGAGGWTAVALGQSVGGAAAVLVELAWSLSGPQEAAACKGEHAAKALYALGLASKALVFVPAAAVSALCGSILTGGPYSADAALMGIASAAAGLSMSWFFVGTSRPMLMILTDALPRNAGIILGWVLIRFTGYLWAYPLLTLSGAVAAPIIGCIKVGISGRFILAQAHGEIVLTIRRQLMGLGARAFSALYIALPISVVAIANRAIIADFSAVERYQRLVLAGIAFFPSVFQGWVGSSIDLPERLRRVRRSIAANLIFGLSVAVLYQATSAFAMHVLFSGVASVSRLSMAISSVMIVTVCVSRATGNVALVAFDRVGYIALSAVLAAIIGVPAIFVGARLIGVYGALAAELLSELIVLTVQLFALYTALKAAQPREINNTDRELAD